MRGFIISICLLISLIVGIFINAYYINSTFTELYILIEKINISKTNDNEQIILDIEKTWEEKSKLLFISSGYKEINEVEKAIYSLKSANTHNDKTQMEISLNDLKYAINAIIRLERFSISNIL